MHDDSGIATLLLDGNVDSVDSRANVENASMSSFLSARDVVIGKVDRTFKVTHTALRAIDSAPSHRKPT